MIEISISIQCKKIDVKTNLDFDHNFGKHKMLININTTENLDWWIVCLIDALYVWYINVFPSYARDLSVVSIVTSYTYNCQMVIEW